MSVPTRLKTSPWSRSSLKSIGTIKPQTEVNIPRVVELCYIWVDIKHVMVVTHFGFSSFWGAHEWTSFSSPLPPHSSLHIPMVLHFHKLSYHEKNTLYNSKNQQTILSSKWKKHLAGIINSSSSHSYEVSVILIFSVINQNLSYRSRKVLVHAIDLKISLFIM